MNPIKPSRRALSCHGFSLGDIVVDLAVLSVAGIIGYCNLNEGHGELLAGLRGDLPSASSGVIGQGGVTNGVGIEAGNGAPVAIELDENAIARLANSVSEISADQLTRISIHGQDLQLELEQLDSNKPTMTVDHYECKGIAADVCEGASVIGVDIGDIAAIAEVEVAGSEEQVPGNPSDAVFENQLRQAPREPKPIKNPNKYNFHYAPERLRRVLGIVV
ncbi:MAG: hypothetical protein KDN22_09200 [Verrucomicrobiae bacterium]|nr:hypothetical protein [Verrucomicrobiae bacterium]